MPATLSLLISVFTDPASVRWRWPSGRHRRARRRDRPLSGASLDHFWWGRSSSVNVPLCVVAIVAGRRLIPESRDPRPARRLDGRRMSGEPDRPSLAAVIEHRRRDDVGVRCSPPARSPRSSLGAVVVQHAPPRGRRSWISAGLFKDPALTPRQHTITVCSRDLGFLFLSTHTAVRPRLLASAPACGVCRTRGR